jgi:hypothetical protein
MGNTSWTSRWPELYPEEPRGRKVENTDLEEVLTAYLDAYRDWKAGQAPEWFIPAKDAVRELLTGFGLGAAAGILLRTRGATGMVEAVCALVIVLMTMGAVYRLFGGRW